MKNIQLGTSIIILSIAVVAFLRWLLFSFVWLFASQLPVVLPTGIAAAEYDQSFSLGILFNMVWLPHVAILVGSIVFIVAMRSGAVIAKLVGVTMTVGMVIASYMVSTFANQTVIYGLAADNEEVSFAVGPAFAGIEPLALAIVMGSYVAFLYASQPSFAIRYWVTTATQDFAKYLWNGITIGLIGFAGLIAFNYKTPWTILLLLGVLIFFNRIYIALAAAPKTSRNHIITVLLLPATLPLLSPAWSAEWAMLIRANIGFLSLIAFFILIQSITKWRYAEHTDETGYLPSCCSNVEAFWDATGDKIVASSQPLDTTNTPS